MTHYLSLDDLLFYGHLAVGGALVVRDHGLVDSALYRPQSSALGQDAYPTVWTKAAALLQSLATNHGFVDGNKRTALAACYAFLAMNDEELVLSEDDAVALVVAVATKQLVEVEDIAERLQGRVSGS